MLTKNFFTLSCNKQKPGNILFFGTPDAINRPLIILIGAQRGLCGGFNSILRIHLDKELAHFTQQIPLLVLGKQIIFDLKQNYRFSILQKWPDMQVTTVGLIAQEIIAYLEHNRDQYDAVLVISNHLKTFFIQRPQTIQLIPFQEVQPIALDTHLEEYRWEQNPEELLDNLLIQMLQAQLHYLIFESLLAEQAARFLSMDNATRNARTLLDETQLQYNKLRQAKITKELTELTGSF